MDKLTNKELLTVLFYDIDKGYVPADKLLKQAKEIRPEMKIQEVRDFVNKQPSREKKKYKGENSFIAKGPLDEIELDIADMRYSDGSQDYMLVGIDIFTKLGHAVPIPSKSANETAIALKQILDKIGIPKAIYTDCGSEFLGATAKLMKENNIEHITTLAHANFAERFIRTLKNMINDRVEITNNDWVKFVPNVLKQYNNTEHRTTKLKPVDAVKDENVSVVKSNILDHAKKTRMYEDLHVGDMVRILKKKDKYGKLKEHVSNWSDEKYKITDISTHHEVTYFKLDKHSKLFLRHEIKLTSE
jgi:hypothetical protein